MPASSSELEDLLPHRPPMTLIDEVVAFDVESRSLTAAVTARREWCENWVAIELMAQTAAALAGRFDRESGYQGPPRPGFLLGTRKLDLRIPRFEPGRRYLIKATNVFADSEAASFDCEITDAGEAVATATLNAYRPEDMSAFLAEQRK